MVLSKTTLYCPPSTTHSNKGGYTWPRTLAGAVKVLTCMFSIDHSGVEKAYRSCNQDGSWNEPDTSRSAGFDFSDCDGDDDNDVHLGHMALMLFINNNYELI